ncbi:ATP-dependent zinc protease [Maridesulfovibrio sp.]|uniref:ATP-dependent zinc protease family protein n=1 Tax=Maridesulfovibrio sp. TaxID=2795000 RepID=UPI003BAABF76
MNRLILVAVIVITFSFIGCAHQNNPSPKMESPLKAKENAPKKKHSKPVGLPVIGQMEYVVIVEANMKLAARIDTGATTSSISATNVKRYERDGENWVRFTITDPRSKKSTVLERPLERVASIKRHGAETQERPSVMLNLILGDIKAKTEFTLTDRSKFEFPVLIGRSFLDDRAVVDVNQEYSTSPLK